MNVLKNVSLKHGVTAMMRDVAGYRQLLKNYRCLSLTNDKLRFLFTHMKNNSFI